MRSPRVGVLAGTTNLARTLAVELGIRNALELSPKSVHNGSGRGVHLGALLVADECWPPHNDLINRLLPCLEDSGGYIFQIHRIDPKKTGPQ